MLLRWPLLLFAACTASELGPLLVDGHELHASLVTKELDDGPIRHVPRDVLRDNPYLSTDVEFIEAIAHSASQGQIGGEGIRAALYAVYLGERELGLYGLEASSTTDANRLERALHEIWAHNERLGRARIHHKGKVLVVLWNDGASSSCWEAANAWVVERLAAP